MEMSGITSTQKLRRAGLISVGFVIFLIGLTSAAMNAGFCLSERRILSEIEYYRGAI